MKLNIPVIHPKMSMNDIPLSSFIAVKFVLIFFFDILIYLSSSLVIILLFYLYQ